MRRREFITGLVGAAATWPITTHAQQPPKIHRIGFLRAAAPNEKEFDAFRSGLRSLGYNEGQNVVIEQRYASGAYDRVGQLASELVHQNMDVIVVDGTASAKPAQAATVSIPIVFTLVDDPVALGLVASLARPGGNLTGLTHSVGFELMGKRVELLKDILPGLTRLAILRNPAHPSASGFSRETEKVASAFGMSVQPFDARAPSDLPAAFAAMVTWRANGVITLPDGMFNSQRAAIVTLARENRLPSVHPETSFVEAGGLVAYGPSIPDLFRRAASYAVKILQGAKPADVPVEQPTKFELVINLKTARAFGLNISREFLLRADEVIE